jgi:hypothetical protein
VELPFSFNYAAFSFSNKEQLLNDESWLTHFLHLAGKTRKNPGKSAKYDSSKRSLVKYDL